MIRNSVRTPFLLLTFFAMSSISYAQTPLFQKEGRGELETQSFSIERAATLTIFAKTDSGKVEEYGSASVGLKKDVGNDIETVEYWTLELADTKVANDQKPFRVRVDPGTYFFEIDTVGDVSWGVRLVHNQQADQFSFREKNRSFIIESNGKKVAFAETRELAKKITDLLNASNR